MPLKTAPPAVRDSAPQVIVDLQHLASYLDSYLRIEDIDDHPHALNGLQVESGGTVSKIAAAVDVCRATIERAIAVDADFMLVHHGIFWGGLQPLTGHHGYRVRSLVQHGVALYAAHLPLDLHPEVGNNVILARMLGLEAVVEFGEYEGQVIGRAGTVSVAREEFVERISSSLGSVPRVIAAGPDQVRRVGVVSGGGSRLIAQAADAGLDTFVTGEGSHHTYFEAEEAGLNLIYAGHYATETVGVKALAEHLASRFGLSWEFLDHPTGL